VYCMLPTAHRDNNTKNKNKTKNWSTWHQHISATSQARNNNFTSLQ
jgi:hypothetical protein